MTESERCPNVIVNFWEWYERHQERARRPIARLALDKCEESYRCSDWDRFDYWFSIYRRERPCSQNSDARHDRQRGS